jgi:hypothetical protein
MVLSRFPKNCWRPDRDDITTSSGTTSFLNTSTANSGQSVGQIGDAGIDDIIDQGALGLDRVYIQSNGMPFRPTPAARHLIALKYLATR